MAKYAIVETGGKQYRVQPGTVIRVESLPADEGDQVELDKVLMVSDEGDVTLGAPTVPGAKVMAEVVGQGKAKKVIVFKFKAKVHYRKKNGHRQLYTQLRVNDILLSGAQEPAPLPEAEEPASEEPKA